MRKLLILLAICTSLAAHPIKNDNFHNINPIDNNVLIHKQFYTHSGPEPPSERKITIGKATKNFRILFVNLPSPYEKLRRHGIKALQVSLAPGEEKLALYVLSAKKNKQEVEIVNFEGPTRTPASDPEVHFVKYKDKEDIAETQRRITDHYLALD